MLSKPLTDITLESNDIVYVPTATAQGCSEGGRAGDSCHISLRRALPTLDHASRSRAHMTISIITALFLLVSSYSLEFVGWIVALIASIVLLWTRSTVLSLPTSLVRILVAPTLILCLGLHGIYSNSLYDVGKDVWYFSGPVVYIAFGYLVFERLGSWQRLVQPLVVIGAYSCLVTIVGVVSNREQLLATTTVERLSAHRRPGNICSYFTGSPARSHETCRVAHDRGNAPDNGKGNCLYPVGDSGSILIFQNPHCMPGRRPRLHCQSKVYSKKSQELHGVSPWRSGLIGTRVQHVP